MSDSHKGQIPWNKGCVSKYKGVPRSELTKKKISQSIKANGKLAGKNNPNWGKTGSGVTFYGHHHTEETKKKIGAASKSRSMSEETKAKLRDRMLNHTSYTKGMHWSEETKQKQRLGNILYRLRMKFQLIMLYFIVSFSY